MAPPASRRTQAQRREVAERRMLEAGVRLVAERGLTNLNLADVGVAAGYSKGLPAHYFGAKTDYLAALTEFIVAEWRAQTVELRENPGLAALAQIIRGSCSLGAANDPLRLCLSHVTQSEQAFLSRFDAGEGGVTWGARENIQEHLIEGIARGEIRRGINASRSADVILVTVLGLQAEWLRDSAFDLEAAGREFVDMLIPGLAATPEAAASAQRAFAEKALR